MFPHFIANQHKSCPGQYILAMHHQEYLSIEKMIPLTLFLCGLWPFLFFTAFAAADVDDAAAAEAAAAAATVTVL